MPVTDLLAKLQANLPPFSKLLGIELLAIAPDKIDARMLARDDLGNGSGVMHGGAYMAFADYLGAVGTVVNLRKGSTTTTLESKTNFFAPALIGTVVLGQSTPLHRGRRTMVWQTRVTNEEGRLLALVTQTQMVIEAPKPD